MKALTDFLNDIASERERQNHPDMHPNSKGAGLWPMVASLAKARVDEDAKEGTSNWASILFESYSILFEEVAEAIEAAAKGDIDALDVELNQIAAVAVSWRQALARRRLAQGAATLGAEVYEVAGTGWSVRLTVKDDRIVSYQYSYKPSVDQPPSLLGARFHLFKESAQEKGWTVTKVGDP